MVWRGYATSFVCCDLLNNACSLNFQASFYLLLILPGQTSPVCAAVDIDEEDAQAHLIGQ